MLKLRVDRNREDPTKPIWRQGGTDIHSPTAQDVFNWWMEYDVLPGQLNWFEDEEEIMEEGE